MSQVETGIIFRFMNVKRFTSFSVAYIVLYTEQKQYIKNILKRYKNIFIIYLLYILKIYLLYIKIYLLFIIIY